MKTLKIEGLPKSVRSSKEVIGLRGIVSAILGKDPEGFNWVGLFRIGATIWRTGSRKGYPPTSSIEDLIRSWSGEL